MSDFSIVLPAGTHFVGDPCYCFKNDTSTWNDILRAWTLAQCASVFDFRGHKLVFVSVTQAVDNNGRVYPIDSQTFGIMPRELIEKRCGDAGLHMWHGQDFVCRLVGQRLWVDPKRLYNLTFSE